MVPPNLSLFCKKGRKRKSPSRTANTIPTYANKSRNPSQKRIKEIKTSINQKVLETEHVSVLTKQHEKKLPMTNGF